jgi:hypothetical protein
LSAFAHLFAALISYSVDRAASITELEERCAVVCGCERCRGLGGDAGRPCVWAELRLLCRVWPWVNAHNPAPLLSRHKQQQPPNNRLDRAGYEVGARMMELLSWREKQPRRRPDPLDALKFVHSVAWPALFGRPAADLQQAHAADDEFMIRDDDLLVRWRDWDGVMGGLFVGGACAG